jgi:hypothetical protein
MPGIDALRASGRRLIHIPIVHTDIDLGGLSGPVQRAGLRVLGTRSWRKKLKSVEAMWAQIERGIEDLGPSSPEVRLYQDGLPVCGREAEIVAQLAEKGSLNHRLLQRLIEKGASLMGTESAQLLVEEYERAIEAARSSAANYPSKAGRAGPSIGESRNSSADSLLARRDRFIADRINSTLRRGETGILFLGMLHSLDNLLAEDIEVVRLHPLESSDREGDRENE